ncbi:class I SAM-dependent methyltransferase [Dethiosulfatarculus sandiegensis]|uniref:Methyltransferase domain-containing protein n=1 Tax=Dethiosulfatarculus sandiegensis TaxID=1429043 RepID=A0A0D2GC96_9BACT|nr:class I SAM-dependent methyltransferase [Dethiosulfatarculus sandiegensis]KIX12497.1 hypothetical protein X474_18735 [Dethiosulfatarculus sandiegensis]
MQSADSYYNKLVLTNPLREPLFRSIVSSLSLPRGSEGLDAGCGAGLQSLILAEATGPKGRVTGIDISPDLIHHARNAIKKRAYADFVRLLQGDLNHLPFKEASFDWIWSADAVGYGDHSSLRQFSELSRVLKPGGTAAILAWSSEQLLPGYPGLEARLRATGPGLAPFSERTKPEEHFLRGTGLLKKAGFAYVSIKSFLGDVQGPLDNENRIALEELLAMRWPGAEKELGPKEADLLERLISPDSKDYILKQKDYYAFFTYTMLFGVKGE